MERTDNGVTSVAAEPKISEILVHSYDNNVIEGTALIPELGEKQRFRGFFELMSMLVRYQDDHGYPQPENDPCRSGRRARLQKRCRQQAMASFVIHSSFEPDESWHGTVKCRKMGESKSFHGVMEFMTVMDRMLKPLAERQEGRKQSGFRIS